MAAISIGLGTTFPNELAMGFVYAIVNTTNSATYIGSTVKTVDNRWRRHLKDLRAGRHHSCKLQRAWDKYGEDAFVIETLEKVSNRRLLSREQWHIDLQFGRGRQLSYNMSPTAGNTTGIRWSKKAKIRQSAAKVGVPRSLSSILKQANTWALRYGKRYSFVSPEGFLFETNNLRSFAREHNLDSLCLSLLSRQKIKHHRGWCLVGHERKTISLIDPSGRLHENIIFSKEWCSREGLNYRVMWKLQAGKLKSAYGWKLIK